MLLVLFEGEHEDAPTDEKVPFAHELQILLLKEAANVLTSQSLQSEEPWEAA